ncbi:MAG: pyridoxal phosphate-dependent aminotransferase [Ignavibacteriales bacterium]|nr:pyridoxal phosphate-dependent aminotransferase [Ignavibacteriales bacterium]
MTFSERTNWHRQQNKLTELLGSLRNSGRDILDLTVSNPTECGFVYPEKEILSSFENHLSMAYDPNPRGLLSARQSVSEYYKQKNITVDPSNIFLTASTSEAYSILFKLLCNAGDSVLVPKPSYPLFEYLAQINDVGLQHYDLLYDGEWRVDIESFAPKAHQSPAENNSKIGKIKAIVIVNPHNPTGMFLKNDEYSAIKEFARQHNLAIIVDEVFVDYAFEDDENRISSTASEADVLTFTLNGISKMIGLPQMKLGWLVVSGQLSFVNEAIERLQIICDTFLSVNTPVQVALPKLLTVGKNIQSQILKRVKSNYNTLLTTHNSLLNTPCSPLLANGGWYGIIRVPRIKSNEEWALQLLEKKCVYVYPGYFFDFVDEGYLVVSLLVENSIFQKAVSGIVEYVSTA